VRPLEKPLVTIGAVTKRPFCRDWLEWNVLRQTYRPLELLLIDGTSSESELLPVATPAVPFSGDPEILHRVVRAGSALRCGELRNLALAFARGELLCWFDDDDWQHPDKIAWMVRELSRSSEPWVGWDRGWLWDLFRDRVVRITGHGIRVSNGAALYRTEAARLVPYDNGVKASDGRWLVKLGAAHRTRGLILTDDRVHSIWTRHGRNTSPNWIGGVRTSRNVLSSKVEPKAWDDSTARFEALAAAFTASG
jgi:hypothetical protein